MTLPLTRFQELVQTIYANGWDIELVDDCYAMVIDEEGRNIHTSPTVSIAMKQRIMKSQAELHEMLTGDPMDGYGYEGRDALFQQAMKFADRAVKKKYGKEGFERAEKVMCSTHEMDRLREAWAGDFETYRKGLKEFVKAGIEAAAGRRKPEMKVRAQA
jgi:hypothetical protein